MSLRRALAGSAREPPLAALADARRLFAACVCGFGYAWSVFLKPMAAAHGLVERRRLALVHRAHVHGRRHGARLGLGAQVRAAAHPLLLGGALFVASGIVALGSVTSLAADVRVRRRRRDRHRYSSIPARPWRTSSATSPTGAASPPGFLTAGAGIGGMLWAPVAVWLIDQYGTARGRCASWASSFFVGHRRVLPARRDRAGRVRAGRVERAGGAARRRRSRARRRTGGAMLRLPLFYLLAVLFLMGTLVGDAGHRAGCAHRSRTPWAPRLRPPAPP